MFLFNQQEEPGNALIIKRRYFYARISDLQSALFVLNELHFSRGSDAEIKREKH
jgi:hypothetical protein